jgi:hypothetical protein
VGFSYSNSSADKVVRRRPPPAASSRGGDERTFLFFASSDHNERSPPHIPPPSLRPAARPAPRAPTRATSRARAHAPFSSRKHATHAILARAHTKTQVGDARTASDSRAFLLGFLKKFPGFAASELYIAGESYAGHYVPQLAAAILDGNAAAAAAGTSVGALNLQGILVGNAWTDAPTDNYGAVRGRVRAGARTRIRVLKWLLMRAAAMRCIAFSLQAFHWWSHYHISGATLDAMSSACNFSQVGPIRAAGRAHARIRDGLGPLDASSSRSSTSRVADDCEAACDQAMSEMGPLNIYQLCVPAPPVARYVPGHELLSESAAGVQ